MKLDSKYLGLPSFWEKSKFETYSFIIEQALNKMQGDAKVESKENVKWGERDYAKICCLGYS